MFGEAEFWFALIKVAAIVSFMVVVIVAIVLRLSVASKKMEEVKSVAGLLDKNY